MRNNDTLKLRELHRIWKNHAKKLTKIHKQRTDKYSSKLLPKFKPGQQVLVKNFRQGHFEPKYNNNFRVIRQINPTTVELKTPQRKIIRVNSNHMKPVKNTNKVNRSKTQETPQHDYMTRSQAKALQ